MFSVFGFGKRENGHISLCEGSVDKDHVRLQMMKHRERNTTPTPIPKANRETDSVIMATADSAVRSLSEVEKYLNSRNDMVTDDFLLLFSLSSTLHSLYRLGCSNIGGIVPNRHRNGSNASIWEHLFYFSLISDHSLGYGLCVYCPERGLVAF